MRHTPFVFSYVLYFALTRLTNFGTECKLVVHTQNMYTMDKTRQWLYLDFGLVDGSVGSSKGDAAWLCRGPEIPSVTPCLGFGGLVKLRTCSSAGQGDHGVFCYWRSECGQMAVKRKTWVPGNGGFALYPLYLMLPP
ncbi:hypothetical protein SODALDRAFT_83140 [Sodiomyces alkalinus F11]|uniref:Uncharacterized protein n=1 Tax=Sodiomyces alkalinus (strain CBS 110278 / VKM F-3762 / F11) TaxID=1314773 RepID=A0A3N2PJI8_SODAK|nr:hypothetical protein SODALDRAFT_83140 [Sodiomyces alkalinus F11]ROT34692.1 hypothetical protein SODALDRAFT_83140 [Sodiomyces alkalinus F11]